MLQLGGGWAPAGVRVVTLTFQGKTFQTPPTRLAGKGVPLGHPNWRRKLPEALGLRRDQVPGGRQILV